MSTMRSSYQTARRLSLQAGRARCSAPCSARVFRTISTTARIDESLPPLTPRPPPLQRPSIASVTRRTVAPVTDAPAEASNPALAFPCLDALETRSADLAAARSLASGPEPTYTSGATLRFHCDAPLLLDWGGVLPEFDLAYETWGRLNADRSNAVLLCTGLSASSHARSTTDNPKPGWWEKMMGPGGYLDTERYFVICTNVLGGCYGSTGPRSIDPADGRRYATRFPILTLEDMVRAQFRLLDHLGISRLHASVGGSMGGMQALAAAVLHPERVGRIASISGCARGHPYGMALRHTQRQILMMDPHWNRGFYYDGVPPHTGMKLAREVATVTYRSGLEWEQRFGRRRADPSKPPALCPDFLIETYLDHAGEKFCLEFDANSMLYVSKAMDLFDLGAANQAATAARRSANEARRRRQLANDASAAEDRASCSLTLPDKPYTETPQDDSSPPGTDTSTTPSSPSSSPPRDLIDGLSGLRDHPTLVIGVATDLLFPAWQQRELAESLMHAGNRHVTHVELGPEVSLYGHDTFLIDAENIGGRLRTFLADETAGS